MPEFILNSDGEVAAVKTPNGVVLDMRFQDLDAFTQGYIEAMFFTNECPGVSIAEFRTPEFQARLEEGQTDGSLPGEAGFSDLAPETLKQIITDCAKFQAENESLLTAAYEHGGRGGYDETMAGRDFWYTRNGHGVGFWDRGLGDIGAQLSETCGWRTKFGELNAYFGDDDKVRLL